VSIAAALRGALGSGGSPGRRPYLNQQEGQRLARRELSKLAYQHGTPITSRIIHAIDRFLDRTPHVPVPGGWPGIVILVAILAAVIAVVLLRIGPVRRSGRQRTGALLDGRPLSARDYRENAHRLAGQGDYSAAIVDLLRAVSAELEERRILRLLPGRTADELAREAGAALPTLASDLRSAALLFDDVRYGDRTGTEAGYRQLGDLDEQVRATRPVAPATPAPASAVVP
jgi:hypothetical protein